MDLTSQSPDKLGSPCFRSPVSSSSTPECYVPLVNTLKENVDTESLAVEYYTYFKKDNKFVTLQFINDLMRLSGFNGSLTSIDVIRINDNVELSSNPVVLKPKISDQLGNFLYKFLIYDNGCFMFKNNFYVKLIDFVIELMNNGWDSFRVLGSILGMKMISAALYLDEIKYFDIIWSKLYFNLIRQGLKDYCVSVIYNILKEFGFWAINHFNMLKRPDLDKYLKRAILFRNLLNKHKGYEIVHILARNHADDEGFLNLFKFAKRELIGTLTQKGSLKELNIKTLYYLSGISDKLQYDKQETEHLYMAVFNPNSTVGAYAARYFYETMLKGMSTLEILENIVVFSTEAYVKNNDLVADSFSWFFIKSDLTEEWQTLINRRTSAPASSLLHAVVKRIVSNEPSEFRKSTSKNLNKTDRIKFIEDFTSNFKTIWFELIESNYVRQDKTSLKHIICMVQYFKKEKIHSQALLHMWLKLKDIFLQYLSDDVISLSCRMMEFLEKQYNWEGHYLKRILNQKNNIIDIATKKLMDYLNAPLSIAYEPAVLEQICAPFKYFLFDDTKIWFQLLNIAKKFNLSIIQRNPEQITIVMNVMFELMFRKYQEMKWLISCAKKIDENSVEYFNIRDEFNTIEIDLLPRIYELELHFTPLLDPSLTFEMREKAFFYLSKLFRNCGPHMVYGEDANYSTLFLNFEDDFPSKLKLLAMECLDEKCKENKTCCRILDKFLMLIGHSFISVKLLHDFILNLGMNEFHDNLIVNSIKTLLTKLGVNTIERLAKLILGVLIHLYNEPKHNIKKGQEILLIIFEEIKGQNGLTLIYKIHTMIFKEVNERENSDFILFVAPLKKFLNKNIKKSLGQELSKSNKSSDKNVTLYISHLNA